MGVGLKMRMQIEIEKLRVENDRLKAFAEYYANCPCCGETGKCEESCTHENDAKRHGGDRYQDMVDARYALYGE